jgi:hypothetical protein
MVDPPTQEAKASAIAWARRFPRQLVWPNVKQQRAGFHHFLAIGRAPSCRHWDRRMGPELPSERARAGRRHVRAQRYRRRCCLGNPRASTNMRQVEARRTRPGPQEAAQGSPAEAQTPLRATIPAGGGRIGFRRSESRRRRTRPRCGPGTARCRLDRDLARRLALSRSALPMGRSPRRSRPVGQRPRTDRSR